MRRLWGNTQLLVRDRAPLRHEFQKVHDPDAAAVEVDPLIDALEGLNRSKP